MDMPQGKVAFIVCINEDAKGDQIMDLAKVITIVLRGKIL